MKFLQFAVLLTGFAILMNSCSKTPVDVGVDDNTYSTTAAVNKCDYSPYSPGSSFTFEIGTKNPSSGKWSYAENRGNMTAYKDINGKKYTAGTGFFPQDSSMKATEGYIRCDAVGLYSIVKGLNNGADVDFQLLQYPLVKAKTWKSPTYVQTQNSNGITVTTSNTYDFKVVNIGLTRKVKDKTFTEVAEIEESVTSVSGFQGQSFTSKITYSRFYDKKLGIIETIFFNSDPFTGARSDTALVQKLVSYSIK